MPASEAKPTAKPRHYEDDEFDPPIRRRGYRDRDDFDDVEDDDYVGFRIRRRGEFPPHRGGLILALGLVAIVGGLLMLFPFAIGPIAWLLGSLDLRAMNDGRMDPEGRSMTQAGQVLGLVSTVFLVLGVLGIGCCFFARIP
jgi:hypothetical protein